MGACAVPRRATSVWDIDIIEVLKFKALEWLGRAVDEAPVSRLDGIEDELGELGAAVLQLQKGGDDDGKQLARRIG